MIFNRFVLLLAMFGFMSPLAVSASMEADVAGSGGPVSHVGTGFFSEDGDLVPRYKTLFEEVAKEITDLFPGTLTDSDGWWKKCLSPMKPPYNQAAYCRFSDSDSCSYAYGSPVHERLEGIDYVKGPDYFTGKLVYFPLSMDSVSPQTIPPLIPLSMDSL